MFVSPDGFNAGIGRRLESDGEQEIVGARDGRQRAGIMPPPDEREAMLRSLRGILPSTATLEEACEGRIAKYETHI